MKVAIVYDWVNRSRGGAERILQALHEIWPQAPLYTSVYNQNSAQWGKSFPNIYTSFVNYLPLAKKRAYWYYPFTVIGFEQFDFDKYDLVISVTTGPAKAIITKPETNHICYCLTPPIRHVWRKDYFPFSLAQKQDYLLGQRPDYYFATCRNVADRINQYYHRRSQIIYPGVNLAKFKLKPKLKSQKYYLLVSRLVDYKRVDLAIKTFNQLGWLLRIVGTGRLETKLKLMAKSNIEFLGEVSDKKLVRLYQQCQALIFPQEEDFGLTPIEAQACGRPVIAYQAGGALETVIPGQTGEFFSPQTSAALIGVLKKFDTNQYSPEACRTKAANFSVENFKDNFKSLSEGYVPKQP